MKVRDLERLLIESGVGAAKIDAVTRRLRDAGSLPKGGRGVNAPDIGAVEAAAILLAVAGSTKGVEADSRLAKIQSLPPLNDPGGRRLLEAITEVLRDPEQLARVRAIRVSRTARHAVFIYDDDPAAEFRSPEREPRRDRFYVEGVIPAGLLKRISDALHETHVEAKRGSSVQSRGEKSGANGQ